MKSVSYSPEELKNKWKDLETSFPIFHFIPIVLFQFCAGVFPLIMIDYGLYYIFEFYPIVAWVRILFIPVIFIINAVGYIYFTAKACKLYTKILNRISPPQQGTFTRVFAGEEGKEWEKKHQKYYYLRGVLYKWPVFYAKKSIFPWSVNYMLRQIGENDIHKNAWLGDTFVGLEFTKFDDGSVMQVANVVSSHEVNSIFGSLNVYEVPVGKNVVVGPNSVVGPGANLTEKGICLTPKTMFPKNWDMAKELKGLKRLYGSPLVPKKAINSMTSFMELVPKEFLEKTNYIL